jgi:ATP synthase protein I
MGVLVALSGGWWMDSMPVLWSAGYGTLVVAVPAAFMAWGLRKRVDDNHAGAGAVRFMSWEFVKIAGSLGMLAAAPWVLQPISWPALVAGLVVGTKVYWLALLLQRRRR